MEIIFGLLAFVVFLFFMLLLGRVVLSWVQMFARDWRPTGVAAAIVEIVYSVTDPPIKLLRSVIPPLTIGQLRVDIAFIIVFSVTYILMAVLSSLAGS